MTAPESRRRGPLLPLALMLAIFALSACRPSFAEATQTAVALNSPTPTRTIPTATAALTATPAPTAVRTAPTGDILGGLSVFNGVGQCNICHTVDGSQWGVGPDLKGIGPRLDARGIDAVPFLHESIVDVLADITEGYNGDLMPKNYADLLTPEQIDDLIAYMLSL